MIICDTREQKNGHILQYLKTHEIPYVERKLETGDYMLYERMDTTIDRKQGVRFIILCEHGGQYKTMKDVANYRSRYSRISGRELMERMYAAHIAYGVEFLFCDKRSTGRRIAELLGCSP